MTITVGSNMHKRRIVITDFDLRRLMNLVGDSPMHSSGDQKYLGDLRAELESAAVVPPSDVPPDIITMNSKVLLKDLKTDEYMTCTLVFPGAANVDEGQISILAPIGTAMLGYRAGDVIDWEVPAGKVRLKVEQVLYQPEAAGNVQE